MANFSANFPADLLAQLRQKSSETLMTESQLVRLAVMSFLAKEDALSDYLTAIAALEEKLAVMLKRQEDFTRAIGNICMVKDIEKSSELRQKFADRITQITDTVN